MNILFLIEDKMIRLTTVMAAMLILSVFGVLVADNLTCS